MGVPCFPLLLSFLLFSLFRLHCRPLRLPCILRLDILLWPTTIDRGFSDRVYEHILDVEGTVQMTGFKMPTGSVDGYVLTSGAQGVGNWQQITGVGADNDWEVVGNDMYSKVSGNVGIGTTNPGAKLHVEDQTVGFKLRSTGTNAGDAVRISLQTAQIGGLSAKADIAAGEVVQAWQMDICVLPQDSQV